MYQSLDTKNNSESFASHLQIQIMQNERLKNLLLAIIFSLLLFMVTIVSFIYTHELRSILGSAIEFQWVSLFFLILIVRSLNIRRIIGNRMEKRKRLPISLAYTNTFFEVSMITIIMIFLAQSSESMYVLITPLPFLYFIFIIMSTLDLNYKLCIFTGAVASIEYIMLSLYYYNQYGLSLTLPILKIEAIYLAKGGILLISGIIAGLIAREIRKKVFNAYESAKERKDIAIAFGQQVSPAIVDEIIHSKQAMVSKKIPVCIMFLDIKGFTPFSEGKAPEEIITYQNDTFGLMIDKIINRRGIIHQFMGDGFMATFGAPIPSDNDCQNAVSAAIDIYSSLNEESEKGNIPKTEIRIGIHYGEVVTGNVGNEIRKQYSVTGNPVILAARLEQLNKKYKSTILVSSEVQSRINLETIEAQSLGLVSIKGRSEEIEVFKVL